MKSSYIIISYNQEKYIYNTLLGVLNQSTPPDEVIIADDGSSDKTQKIIRNFVRSHGLDNWICILNNTNQGITKNLRNAIQASKGEILVLNAGDDIPLPKRVEISLNAFKEFPNASIVTGNLDVINSNGEIIGEIINSTELCNNIEKTLKNGMPFVHPVGQSIKRKIFDEFGPLPTDVPNEDDQISFRGLLSGEIVCLPNKIMQYRIHDRSASSWIRDKSGFKSFYNRFKEDMPIRRRHMELWKAALAKTAYGSNDNYQNLINHRIELYNFLENLDNHSFLKRINFLHQNSSFLSFKEKYYCFLGQYGVISWRIIRNIIK